LRAACLSDLKGAREWTCRTTGYESELRQEAGEIGAPEDHWYRAEHQLKENQPATALDKRPSGQGAIDDERASASEQGEPA